MERRVVGLGMVVAAVLLAFVALVMWGNETDRVDRDRDALRYTEALSGRDLPEPEANRAAPIALGAVCAVLFLGGVVLVATSPVGRPDDPT